MGNYGGGKSVVRSFRFQFNTPGLLTGATIFTPTVGEVLIDAWLDVTTAWDGTTPLFDVGTFTTVHTGWFAVLGGGALDVTKADSTAVYPGLAVQGTGINFAGSDLAQTAATALALRRLPARFTTADPLKICVSQDGTNTGTSPAATTGAAILYLRTAPPLDETAGGG